MQMFSSSLDFLLSRIFTVFVVLHTPEGCDVVPVGAAAHCLKGLREKPRALGDFREGKGLIEEQNFFMEMQTMPMGRRSVAEV